MRSLTEPLDDAEGPFTLRVKTDNAGPSNDDQFTLPLLGGPYTVDWGDGTTSDDVTGPQTKTYSAAGEYNVSIIGGTYERFNFKNGGDRLKLLSLSGLYEGTATTADGDFYGCSNLTELPASMTLDSLTGGRDMFRSTSLVSLPSRMTLGSLIDGINMFRDTSLSSLPSGMTLASLTLGNVMFRDTLLTTVPASMTLASLTSGINMFIGVTLTTDSYSSLLQRIEASNSNNNVDFHGGSSTYNAAGGVARQALIDDHSWTITDGGAA